jgi:hypothetical protein
MKKLEPKNDEKNFLGTDRLVAELRFKSRSVSLKSPQAPV